MTDLKRRRNELINQEFNRLLRKHRECPGCLRLTEVYAEVAERFYLSVITAGYVVKGYYAQQPQQPRVVIRRCEA